MRRRLFALGATVLVIALIIGLVVLAALPIVRNFEDDGIDGEVLVADAEFPASMDTLPGGAILYGERLTGDIRRINREGDLQDEPVASVNVVGEAGDQRGLLGVAGGSGDVIYASWTREKDGKLVVGQVAPGRRRVIFVGPDGVDPDNPDDPVRGLGGHLEMGPGGNLVLGIGDAGMTELIDDPDAPNGKILEIDPDRGQGQTGEVISSGWRNPFAFTFDENGRLWVADNSPPGSADRIGLGDTDDAEIADLGPDEPDFVPTALVLLPTGARGDFGLCGFLDRQMRAVDVDESGEIGGDGTAMLDDDVLVEPCSIAAAVRPTDDAIVFATESEIRIQKP